jgi:hypothetical protein
MNKGKCYAKYLFSMSLWIVNKLVSVSFMEKTKSQMKILCPWANLDGPYIASSKGTHTNQT